MHGTEESALIANVIHAPVKNDSSKQRLKLKPKLLQHSETVAGTAKTVTDKEKQQVLIVIYHQLHQKEVLHQRNKAKLEDWEKICNFNLIKVE
jgi:hypothetical protein